MEETKEVIGTAPFEEQQPGETLSFPLDRYATVQTNLSRVKLMYPGRKYVTRKGDDVVYVIRDL